MHWLNHFNKACSKSSKTHHTAVCVSADTLCVYARCTTCTDTATGDLKAVATLSDEQLLAMTTTDKGDLIVPVVVTDSEGNEPIKAEMCWAWVPKIRKAKQQAAAAGSNSSTAAAGAAIEPPQSKL
jgi:Domain of unknown function (DUF4442)